MVGFPFEVSRLEMLNKKYKFKKEKKKELAKKSLFVDDMIGYFPIQITDKFKNTLGTPLTWQQK